MSNRLQDLQKRLAVVEESLDRISKDRRGLNCNCKRETNFHTSDELEAIANVSCPEHGFRDLGFVIIRARWLPLDKEDRQFCKCPRNLHREYLEGKRPKPTADEPMEEANRSAEQKAMITPEQSKQAFLERKAKLEAVIADYYRRRDQHKEALLKAQQDAISAMTEGMHSKD